MTTAVRTSNPMYNSIHVSRIGTDSTENTVPLLFNCYLAERAENTIPPLFAGRCLIVCFAIVA
jgi:hypothetical protein